MLVLAFRCFVEVVLAFLDGLWLGSCFPGADQKQSLMLFGFLVTHEMSDSLPLVQGCKKTCALVVGLDVEKWLTMSFLVLVFLKTVMPEGPLFVVFLLMFLFKPTRRLRYLFLDPMDQ